MPTRFETEHNDASNPLSISRTLIVGPSISGNNLSFLKKLEDVTDRDLITITQSPEQNGNWDIIDEIFYIDDYQNR